MSFQILILKFRTQLMSFKILFLKVPTEISFEIGKFQKENITFLSTFGWFVLILQNLIVYLFI
jgi:hypothetical protein